MCLKGFDGARGAGWPSIVRHRALWLTCVLSAGCTAYSVDGSHAALTGDDEAALEAMAAGVRSWAPTCQGYPSKEHCDDGDMTLFGGLLCASGEPLGCASVRASQGANGRFWRSPRRVDGNLGGRKSFSRDMSMGVLLYLATTKDREAATRWLNWIDSNRPCTLKKPWGGGCLVRGPHRVCRDDENATCTITPGLWALMGKVWDHLGLRRHSEMRRWAATDTDMASLEATFTEPGYELHLKGVAIYLKELLGVQRTWRVDTASDISERQPNNPFFHYLAERDPAFVTALVLDQCPAPGTRPERLFQWSWERADASEAYLESMGWECLFMRNLLTER